MWRVENKTRYAADRNWVRDKAGNHHWVVAVRATFDVVAGSTLKDADEQPPPLVAPDYYGKAGSSSLRYDADLLEIKPTTDVIVNAYAHAPGRRPAPTVNVSIRVGDLHKALRVHGTRVYYRGPTGAPVPTAPEPFESRPIRYEWTYGGTDLRDADPENQRIEARNPLGKGFAIHESSLVDQLAPAIEYPDGGRRPAGFGAIDRAWSPRLELAGTYDAAWEQRKRPLLPDDYDERYAQSAPEDQRPRVPLRGGELVELENLSPEGRWRLELPRARLAFATHFGSRREEHAARLVSVILEPERARLVIVWQTSLAVSRRDIDYLDKTVIDEASPRA